LARQLVGLLAEQAVAVSINYVSGSPCKEASGAANRIHSFALTFESHPWINVFETVVTTTSMQASKRVHMQCPQEETSAYPNPEFAIFFLATPSNKRPNAVMMELMVVANMLAARG
jgi:hypothetical protein